MGFALGQQSGYCLGVSTALYRRYRPDDFADVIGQEHVTEPLMAALEKNRVNHAYLFSGPRGCGKTTSARILARCLNCVHGPTPHPCGECDSCRDLQRGGPGSLDVIEIDAASHGGVDDARDLRERATFAPVRDRYKIFIIDEAHMVTSAGFNALLKIVEEPPEHIKFIFATTEPDKVIGTIRSRTHHYPFRLVPPEPLMAYLQELCEAEKVSVAPGVLSLVARAGGGSVRDSLSVLDQLMAGAGEEGLDYELAVNLLGYTHAALLDDVVDALAAHDSATVFNVVDRVIQTGHDPRRFVEDLLERFRDLIIVKAMPDEAGHIIRGIPEDQMARMRQQANVLGANELSRNADITNRALTDMTGATSPRLHLELLSARLLLPASDHSERGMAARLDRIERHLSFASNDDAAAGGRAGLAASNFEHQASGAVRDPRPREQAAPERQPQERQATAAPAPRTTAAPLPPASAAPAPAPETAPAPTPAQTESPDWGNTWGALEEEPAAPRTSAEPHLQETEQQLRQAMERQGRQRPQQQPAPEQPRQEERRPEQRRPEQAQQRPQQPQRPESAQQPQRAEHPQQQSSQPHDGGAHSGGAGSVEMFRRAWPEIMNRLSDVRRAVWMAVEPNATVAGFDGRTLTIAFSNEGALINFRRREDNAELLRRCVQDVLGVGVAIDAVSGGAAPAGGPGPKDRGRKAPAPRQEEHVARPANNIAPPESAPTPTPAPRSVPEPVTASGAQAPRPEPTPAPTKAADPWHAADEVEPWDPDGDPWAGADDYSWAETPTAEEPEPSPAPTRAPQPEPQSAPKPEAQLVPKPEAQRESSGVVVPEIPRPAAPAPAARGARPVAPPPAASDAKNWGWESARDSAKPEVIAPDPPAAQEPREIPMSQRIAAKVAQDQVTTEAPKQATPPADAKNNGVESAYVDDVPSDEDIMIEDSMLVGRAAVERVLDGKLIEARNLDGTPII